MDGMLGEKVGAAILIAEKIQILDSGTKGDDTFAWMKLQTNTRELHIGSIYAPNERRKRINLWKWMTDTLPQENWVFYRDWNMTNLFDNAIGPSMLIHGSELHAWNQTIDYFNLIDNYIYAGSRSNLVFTRQARNFDH